MYSDPKIWFTMRVTYQREMKVKAKLDRLGIENFVLMTYKVVDADIDNLYHKLVPAIRNLFFVRSTQERISHLKSSNEALEPSRYMIDNTAKEVHTIMTVPDEQMQNFMRVASKSDDSVMFLNDESVIGKEEKLVEIIGVAFEGVTGVIRRVKRCKRVVMEIEGVASVAIVFVSAVMLKEME